MDYFVLKILNFGRLSDVCFNVHIKARISISFPLSLPKKDIISFDYFEDSFLGLKSQVFSFACIFFLNRTNSRQSLKEKKETRPWNA